MNRLLVIIAALVAVGCESSPKPKEAVLSEPSAPATLELDGAALVQHAQLLRDREFASPIAVERDDRFEPSALRGCGEGCRAERTLLTDILFAGKPPVEPAPLAAFDAERRVVRWKGDSRNMGGVRAAVLAELVRALDAEVSSPAPEAQSWDGYLAKLALERGPGVFVSALHSARERQKRIDALALAVRPETLYQLDVGDARFVDGFATREGFAFVAAMMRSGGWSAVELALNERPNRTQLVVRPDRYLAGDQPGAWVWPAEVASTHEKRGFTLTREGHVGPALFVEWLSQQVPAAAARAAYVGFDADSYRIFGHPDGRWLFDWVSLWNSPSTAEQVVAALDAGLRRRTDGARFTVVRKGATVAVLGESKAGADPVSLAALLVDMSPTFEQPRPRGVEFVPTPVDRIQGRPQVSSISMGPWLDEATGVSLDLAALSEAWSVLPTVEPNLPWFAKHASGAVLQYIVEPLPVLDPPFADDGYLEAVQRRFAATMAGEEPTRVTRTDEPVPGGLLIEAEGRIKDRGAEGPIHLRAWHFRSGPFVMTLSLQAPPGGFDVLMAEVRPLLQSIAVPTSSTKAGEGVITFTVEGEP